MAMTPFLFALLAVASPPTEEPAPAQRSALYFEAGFGSPLGVLGIESATKVAPWLEISAGLGLGLNAWASEPSPGLDHM
jgi:hypothetical protein